MPLPFLLDEHLRRLLWGGIQTHNTGGADLIDVVRVGDPPDLPLGSTDPVILLWAEANGRILVSRDAHTMPGHLATHLAVGHHSPGVLLLRRTANLGQIVSTLALIAHAGQSQDYEDQIKYIP